MGTHHPEEMSYNPQSNIPEAANQVQRLLENCRQGVLEDGWNINFPGEWAPQEQGLKTSAIR